MTPIATIPLPPGPAFLAVDERTTHAFIIGSDGVLRTVETRGGAVLNTVTLTPRQHMTGYCVASEAARLFVVTQDRQVGQPVMKARVSVLETTTGELLHAVEVDTAAYGAASDERRGEVYLRALRSLTVLDARHGRLLRRIPVDGAPRLLVVSPESDRLFVVLDTLDEHDLIPIDPLPAQVATITLSTGQLLATAPVGREAYGAALDTATQRLLVANGLDNTVSVLDAQQGQMLQAVVLGPPVEGGPVGAGLALMPEAGRAVVVTVHDQTVRLLDTRTGHVLAAVWLSEERNDLTGAVLVHRRMGQALVPGLRGVRIVDFTTGTLLRTLQVPGAVVALDEQRGRALVLDDGGMSPHGQPATAGLALFDAAAW